MERNFSIEQPVDMSGFSSNPYLCSSSDYIQQIQLPHSKGQVRNLTHPSELGKRGLQGKRKKGVGGVAKKHKRKHEDQPDVFDHLATIRRKQRSQIEWGPQQVPDSSQLDPSPQRGDFLSFHSDPHLEESLRSGAKPRRVEFASEPSCSYSSDVPYEGGEGRDPNTPIERSPSLSQADLLSGEGGSDFEAETEWLVPSPDQPLHCQQQQRAVPVAQVPSLDESIAGSGARTSSMLVPHLSSPSSLLSTPTSHLPLPSRQIFHQLPVISKTASRISSPPRQSLQQLPTFSKASFHPVPSAVRPTQSLSTLYLRSPPPTGEFIHSKSPPPLNAARSTLHLRSPPPASAARSTLHLRSPPPASAARSTLHLRSPPPPSAARSTLHLRSPPPPSAARSTLHLRSPPPPSAAGSSLHLRSPRAGLSSPPFNIFHLPPSFSLQDLAQNREPLPPRPHPQEPLDVRNFAVLHCYPREE